MSTVSSEKVMNDYNKLRNLALEYCNRGKYERALRTIFVACGLMYTYGQIFCDDAMESIVKTIGSKLGIIPINKKVENKTIVFYDGFGNDKRGLAVIYITALIELGYRVKYIAYKNDEKSLIQIKDLIRGEDIYFIQSGNFVKQIFELYHILTNAECSKVILYMYPDDVVAASVFSQYENVMDRFLIDLTDHTFWLGKKAADFYIGYRNYGCNICEQERGINRENVYCLPYYPNVFEKEFRGFPFLDENKKVIFSGGALYKTYGKDNLYYNIVELLLNMDDAIIFYYVGEGDTTEIDKLIKKYPMRVYYSHERDDFFEVMKKCYFYLSTYPYAGGLMTQYALAAKKLPLTLADDSILGDLPVETEEQWYFNNIDTFIDEMKKLVTNSSYLHEQERRMETHIISQEEFTDILGDILIGKRYKKDKVKYEKIDIEKVKKVALNRNNPHEYCGLFCRVKAPFLLIKYPVKFIYGLGVNIYLQKIKRSGKINGRQESGI